MLQKSNISVKKNSSIISCKNDKGNRFSLDYSNDYLRLIMENNDISSLYDIANILKSRIDIPTVQYSLIYKGNEDILHPTLEWRFDNKEQYIAGIVNDSNIDENCFCSYIKLLNGKEIEDYQNGKTIQKKKK